MTEPEEIPIEDAQPVLVNRRGATLLLTLNRPHRLNAVSQPLYVALRSAIEEADSDDDVRAMILTGAGRAFCAGADLKAHAQSDMTSKQRRRYARVAQRANLALQRSRKPVVAAVNGAAVGGGLELAMSCDLMIVASDAKLRLPEIALGTFVGGGLTYTLPERVGMARAKELLLLGDFFDGDHAAAIGMANRSVLADQVLSTAFEFADRLAGLAPVPMTHARRLLRRARRAGRKSSLDAEANALEACMRTEDWSEGIAAHREKRPPRYTGR